MPKTNTTTGKIFVNNGKSNKVIWPSELSQYLSNGWTRGRKSKDGLPSKIPCKHCGKLIRRTDGKTGICKKCFVDYGYQKELNNRPDIVQKRINSLTGRKRSDEFKRKQSENMKKYYKEHPERRKTQGEVFSKAWKEGKHTYQRMNSNSRSKPEKMMFNALVNLFGDSYVTRNYYMSEKGSKQVYPDAVIFGKTAIEYNGDYYHANPSKYQPNQVLLDGITAKEIQDNDAERKRYLLEECLIEHKVGDYSYESNCDITNVITIWESETSHLVTQEDWNEYIENRFLGYDEILSV